MGSAERGAIVIDSRMAQNSFVKPVEIEKTPLPQLPYLKCLLGVMAALDVFAHYAVYEGVG
jgi:hypothetical protein